MGWDRFNFGDRRVKAFLVAVLIGLLFAMLSDHGRGFGGDTWIIWVIIFAALPAISGRRSRRYRRRRRGEYDDEEYEMVEKPKHDFEKPKREPRYALGDDGELIEVDEDQPAIENDEDGDKTLYV